MTGMVGDRIIVESETVGQPTREGEILEVIEGEIGLRYRVRWADGHESIFTPSGGSAPPAGLRTPTGVPWCLSAARLARVAAAALQQDQRAPPIAKGEPELAARGALVARPVREQPAGAPPGAPDHGLLLSS
jgi:hypothetical protein